MWLPQLSLRDDHNWMRLYSREMPPVWLEVRNIHASRSFDTSPRRSCGIVSNSCRIGIILFFSANRFHVALEIMRHVHDLTKMVICQLWNRTPFLLCLEACKSHSSLECLDSVSIKSRESGIVAGYLPFRISRPFHLSARRSSDFRTNSLASYEQRISRPSLLWFLESFLK